MRIQDDFDIKCNSCFISVGECSQTFESTLFEESMNTNPPADHGSALFTHKSRLLWLESLQQF